MSYKTYTHTKGVKPIYAHWNQKEYKEYQDRLKAASEWCDENLEHWGCTPTDNGFHEFWFANEEDYVMFVLRWS